MDLKRNQISSSSGEQPMLYSSLSARNVVLLAFDGVQSLDVTGPMEVFATANRFAGDGLPQYRLTLASAGGGELVTNAGLRLAGAVPLGELPIHIDTFVVAGGSETSLSAAAQLPEFVDQVREASSKSRRTVSICVGALVLAGCGLLDGRRATTHWGACARLGSMRPQISVEPDAIFVCDPPFFTSGGVTAGIDLCLALVEADLGAKVAVAVAKEMLLFIRRPGGQSQFSACIDLASDVSPRLNQLVTYIVENPASKLDLTAMGAKLGMSERTLSRRFKNEVGTPPGQFVERARVERVKSLLEITDWPMARVAERSGLGSVANLHRAFLANVGIPPQAYRERFGSGIAPRVPDGGTKT